MSKEAYYFSHDCNARNDEKILAVRMRHGAEGYGIYFMIIERLRESSNYMSVKDYNIIAFDLRVEAKKVKEIVEDFGLFEFSEDQKYFYSPSLNNRMKQSDERRKKLSEAGKKGAKIKQGTSEVKATLKPPLSHPQALKEKKRKENKLKENKDYYVIKKEKLLSKSIAIEQWGLKNKIKPEKVKELIVEFIEQKQRSEENWETDTEMIKHFEAWLNVICKRELKEKQQSLNTQTFNEPERPKVII